MGELLTLKQIAERLKAPESNLRYYRSRIADFLPAEGAGRRRRYHEEAVAVFERAIQHVQEGMTLEGVCNQLAQEFPNLRTGQDAGGEGAAEASPVSGPPSREPVGEKYGEAIALAKRNGELEEKNAALEARTSELGEKLAEAQEQIEKLKSLLHEKTNIQDAWSAKLIGLRADKIRLLQEVDRLEAQLADVIQDKSEIERNVLKELQELRGQKGTK